MRKRRFEETLEECITAHLEGRRSLEESLSLYPHLAADLEPLLHTAFEVHYAFQYEFPSAHRQDFGLQRFLTAAHTRQQARALTSRVKGFDRARPAWGRRHWGVLGAAAAAVAGIVVVTTVTLNGGGGPEPVVGNRTPAASSTEFVTTLSDAQRQIDRLHAKSVQGQRISGEELSALANTTSRLAAASHPESAGEGIQQQVQEVIQAAVAITTTQPDTEPARDVMDATQGLADKWNLPINPVTTPTPAPTAAPTPAPTQEPAVEPTPAPTAAPEPTPAPTIAPTGDAGSAGTPTPNPDPGRQPF